MAERGARGGRRGGERGMNRGGGTGTFRGGRGGESGHNRGGETGAFRGGRGDESGLNRGGETGNFRYNRGGGNENFRGGRGGGLEEQMGRMALSGPGRGAASNRGARRKMTDTEQKQKVMKSYDLVPTRGNVAIKQGSIGTPINLVANYFRFLNVPDFTVFKYRVDFSDSNLDEQTRRKKFLLRQHKAKLPAHVFDGTMLFSTQRLFPETTQQLVLTSEYTNKNEDDKIEVVEVTIKSVGEVGPTDHDFIHFFSIVWRGAMEEMQLKLLDRNYYDSAQVQRVPQSKLQVWPGYISTIRQQEDELMLCAEVTHKILRDDTALDCLNNILNKTRGNYEAARNAMIGAIVVTHYNQDKTYRVDDINFDVNPMSTFPKRERGQEVQITYKDYFASKYGIMIQDLRQPLLISVPKERDRRGGFKDNFVFLVPELVYMTGLTDEQRSDYRLMQKIGEWTRMEPQKRVETLQKFAQRVIRTEAVTKEMKKWNLEMLPELVRLKGRLLPPEEVTMGVEVHNGKPITYRDTKCDWTDYVRNGLHVGATISRWVIVYPKNKEQEVLTFVMENMMKDASKLGVNMEKPKFEPIQDCRSATYNRALDHWVSKGACFICVVTPSENGDIYAAVKKKLCIETPIPSQVITVSKVLSKQPHKYRSIATKVVIQMATKLKATPWTVKIPFGDAMVIGFDTYHEKAGDMRGSSVGAFVASYDRNFTQFYSKAIMKPEGTELCTEFETCLTESLRFYKQQNGSLPKRIFFYRDGVGAGQIQEVNDLELTGIQRVLKSESVQKEIPGGIRLTFIIVSKRINTRFFVQRGPRYGNPEAGTVVDNTVTCPERYDFFLVSQNVRQGTVNPTSYNVIKDESGFNPDKIQLLTYKLTHLYFNMSSTVRVPSPCLYAHKLADLVGRNLKNPAHPKLNEFLYYL